MCIAPYILQCNIIQYNELYYTVMIGTLIRVYIYIYIYVYVYVYIRIHVCLYGILIRFIVAATTFVASHRRTSTLLLPNSATPHPCRPHLAPPVLYCNTLYYTMIYNHILYYSILSYAKHTNT